MALKLQALPCFLQFESDYGNGEVLMVLGSCFCLVGMFGMCLQYLLLCSNAEMKDVLCYGTFLHP